MTLQAWIFLLLGWGFVLSLFFYLSYRILTSKPKLTREGSSAPPPPPPQQLD
jgi:hypothetical protein